MVWEDRAPRGAPANARWRHLGVLPPLFKMNAIFCIIWDIFVLGGTAYLVGWHGWSPWWFALAVILLFKPAADSEE